MVDTITDMLLSWVRLEPQGIAMVFSDTHREAYMVVEYGSDQEGFKQNFMIFCPTPTSRICSNFQEDCFPMYKIVSKDLGLRIPFSDFQMGVFNHLSLAPS